MIEALDDFKTQQAEPGSKASKTVGYFGTFIVPSEDGDESYTVQLKNGRIVHWHLAIDNERVGSNSFAPV